MGSEETLLTLDALNRVDRRAFVAMLGDTVENAAWVAEALETRRPFPSVDVIWQEIMSTLRGASADAQVALFRGHPELAGEAAMARRMTAHSTREQDRLGLVSMPAQDTAWLGELNRLYRTRFGYPCIV